MGGEEGSSGPRAARACAGSGTSEPSQAGRERARAYLELASRRRHGGETERAVGKDEEKREGRRTEPEERKP
jgi:hypothetical protein